MTLCILVRHFHQLALGIFDNLGLVTLAIYPVTGFMKVPALGIL
jgi:hypothetical protein